MSDLAERLSERLYGVLTHPGDDDTPPFPVMSPLVGLQAATMPPGMAEQIAEDAGLPHPNFALIWLEAVLALVETEGGVTLVDNAELADLRAAAVSNEGKRNQQKDLHCRCGTKLARLSIRDFDTEHPTVNGPEVIKALGSMSPECATQHRAS